MNQSGLSLFTLFTIGSGSPETTWKWNKGENGRDGEGQQKVK